MKVKHLLGVTAGEPFAVSPAAFDEYRELLASLDVNALAVRAGEPVEGSIATMRDGICTIPVQGFITRYDSWWHSYVGGITSLEAIASAFHQAMDDPECHAIVFSIDSPGGQATGNSEFSSQVYASRGKKPIVAYAAGQAASAAYYIASSADRIVASPDAMLGSIGTVLTVNTRKGRDGVEEIVSSQSPNKRPDAGTPEGRSVLQGLVDAMAQVFIDDVARNRGMKSEDVVEKFGAGGMKLGKSAVDAGMADAIGDYESTLKSLAKPKPASMSGLVNESAGEQQPGPTQGNRSPMKFRDFLASLFASENAPKSLDDDVDVNAVLGTEKPAENATPAAPAVDVEALAEQKAAEKFAATLKTAYTANAEAAFAGLLTEKKVVPADKDAFVEQYVDAATLDATSPLASAKRLDRFTAAYADKPANGLTDQKIPTDADPATVQALLKGGMVLPTAAATSDEMQAAEDKQTVLALLAATHEGRAAIAETKTK